MNIALIGYGKMGKAIETIALEKGHKIVLRIDDTNLHEFTKPTLQEADVAIEFTGPQSAVENILRCLEAGTPVVSGTTGWLKHLNRIREQCSALNGSFLYASNFSIGVNIFFELNKRLATLMQQQPGYDVSIGEIHHTQKKDAPSGTAITLAEDIITISKKKTAWSHLEQTGVQPGNEISITSKRIDPAAGTHSIKYSSTVDDIEIIHTAHNREGFASGALMAAEFLHDKKGIFTMKDVLNF